MYCRNCYTKLDPADQIHRCPKCDLAFDPVNSRSYLRRPFPSVGTIIGYVIGTTLVSLVAAFIIAMFQLAGASGH